jgi:hypothetical protein
MVGEEAWHGEREFRNAMSHEMSRHALYKLFRVKNITLHTSRGRRVPGGRRRRTRMERWSFFHVGAAAGPTGRTVTVIIEPIQKRDHLLAIQSSKFGHHLGGEHVLVVYCDVMFNFIRTSPLELAA